MKALTPTEASTAIQRLLESGLDAISFTQHARTRARERGFNTRDVEHLLKTGNVGKATWNEEFRNWTCRVRGADLDDKELTIVAAIDQAQTRVTIVTGF